MSKLKQVQLSVEVSIGFSFFFRDEEEHDCDAVYEVIQPTGYGIERSGVMCMTTWQLRWWWWWCSEKLGIPALRFNCFLLH